MPMVLSYSQTAYVTYLLDEAGDSFLFTSQYSLNDHMLIKVNYEIYIADRKATACI